MTPDGAAFYYGDLSGVARRFHAQTPLRGSEKGLEVGQRFQGPSEFVHRTAIWKDPGGTGDI